MDRIRKPKYKIFDGMKIATDFSDESLRYAANYKPGEGDVFIVSYPKCGNTWLLQIIYSIIHNGEPLPSGKRLYEEIPFLEFVGKLAEEIPPPRYLKSHYDFDRLNISSKAKYIYVARNPKDCCVSYYHHTIGFKEYEYDGTFDEFFECFLNGDVDYDDYADHLLSWWKHREDPNILFLTYEEMKTNIRKVIAKIGQFLGGEPLEIVKKEEMVDKIIENSKFSSMKNREKEMQYEQAENFHFFRKGTVGDWRNYFTEDQKRRLEEWFERKTANTGIAELWRNYDI